MDPGKRELSITNLTTCDNIMYHFNIETKNTVLHSQRRGARFRILSFDCFAPSSSKEKYALLTVDKLN